MEKPKVILKYGIDILNNTDHNFIYNNTHSKLKIDKLVFNEGYDKSHEIDFYVNGKYAFNLSTAELSGNNIINVSKEIKFEGKDIKITAVSQNKFEFIIIYDYKN